MVTVDSLMSSRSIITIVTLIILSFETIEIPTVDVAVVVLCFNCAAPPIFRHKKKSAKIGTTMHIPFARDSSVS